MSSIPPRRALADICDVVGGGTPSRDIPAFWNGTIPWVSPKDMKRWSISDAEEHITSDALLQSATKLVQPPAVLLVVRGMILRRVIPVAVTRVPVALNQDMKALIPHPDVNAEYLGHMLKALESELLQKVETAGHGTGRLATDVWRALQIPVPPLTEQARIVGRISELMDRVDEVMRLRRGARRETSVLSNAALGDVERSLDVTCLPVGELLLESRNGRSIKSSGDSGNGSVLTLAAVRGPIADLDQRKTIVLDDATGTQFAVRRGDVFVSRANTIEFVGLSAIVERRPPAHLIFPDLLIRLRPDEQRIRPKYLAYALRFPGSRRQIRERAVGSSQSMVKISAERLRDVTIPLPDLAVQDRVVSHLSGLFKLTADLHERLSVESARDTLLPGAMLRKAFAGEV